MEPSIHGEIHGYVLIRDVAIVVRVHDVAWELLVRGDAHQDVPICLQTPEQSASRLRLCMCAETKLFLFRFYRIYSFFRGLLNYIVKRLIKIIKN